MLFNSLEFALFFPVVTLFYFLLRDRSRLWLLFIASCAFYMAYRGGQLWFYIAFLFALIGIDYVAGFLIDSAEGFRRKLMLGISLAANLGLLGYFKYFNFINGNLAALFHACGIHYNIPNQGWELPIGLSFHTFQALGYTMEIYYRRYKPERSLLLYALYVLFYPQLVAGPIERPQNLIHQFRESHRFDYDRFVQGFQLMLTGYFKKMAIADRLAPFVDGAYKNPAHTGGGQLLLATYFFAVQIYCDFSGYTDIARGAAGIMGFRIMENFERPYLASSIAEFWRRWHVSLSTWFRDYVYIPLGGSRKSQARTYVNLFIVFLLSGVWHGANWNFVVWGGVHAFLMIAFLSFFGSKPGNRRVSAFQKCLSILITANIVVFTWIFFRAANLADALQIIHRIFTPASWSGIRFDALQLEVSIFLVIAWLAVECCGGKRWFWGLLNTWPKWLRWTAHYLFILILLILILTNPAQKSQEFIYFQF